MRLLITLLTTSILARLVPPAEQGIVALAMPVVLVVTGLSEFGLAQAVIQSKKIMHRTVSVLFWINFWLGLSLSIAVALLGVPAANFFESPEVTWVFVALAPNVMISVLCVQYVAILRRQMHIKQIEICSFAGVVVSAFCAVGAAILGAGYWSLVVQILVAQGINLLLLVSLVRWRPSLPWRFPVGDARSELSFGGFLAIDRLLNELILNLQTVVIGRAFGSADAGLFYRSYTFAEMPRRRIAAPLSGAFVPSLSRLQGEPERFRDMYVWQIGRGNLIMVPIGLFMCLCSDALVLILFGENWLGAIPILSWLGLMTISTLTISSFNWSLVSCGRAFQLFVFRIIPNIVRVMVLIFTAQYGLITLVATFTLANIVIMGPALYLAATKYTPLDRFTVWKAIKFDVLFVMFVGGFCYGLRVFLDLNAIFEAILVGLIISAVFFFRIYNTTEYRNDVMNVIRKFAK
ncbi:MAG: lipopolysaccharide biosynthesis protein [Roseibium sp.]|uniref:lipopolysaccharide biosynthesis protein n=1 Tax=Roseibium sp. TaxID=1936156 RepID=UPI003D9C6155